MASPSLAARAAILGVPYQPNKRPDPLGVVKAFEAMDAKAMATSAGAIVRDTLADLGSVTNPPAHQMAWVTGDATAANNGIYENAGSPSAPDWQRRADLPYGLIHMINTGAGTADAIVATSALPLPTTPGAALLTVNILAANTGNVTLNGKPLRTNSGNEIAPGGLTAGSIHAFLDLGDHFRLLSDQASAAVLAGAEAAQLAAEAARDQAEAIVGFDGSAETVTFDGASSGMAATDVQEAIDELAARGSSAVVATVDDLKAVDTTATQAVYLSLEGWQGQFIFRSGDYAQRAGVDPYNVIAANDTSASAGAWVRDSASWGRTRVILVTGQSNVDNTKTLNWSPPPNLFYWNSSSTQAGYTIAQPATTTIRLADAFGAALARSSPRDRIVVVNVGRGSTPIENWLPDAPTHDMYEACKDAVEACLSYLGLSQIDGMVWWQGESDWFDDKGATYVADWQAVWTRLIAETWFPRETPVTIYSVSHIHTTDTTLGRMNNLLRQIVAIEPQYRTFVDLSTLSTAYWDGTNLHLEGPGILVAGKMGHAALSEGHGAVVSPRRTLVKSANESRISTATLVNDNDLKFMMRASRSYRIKGSVWFQSVVAADIKYGFVGPAAIVINGVLRTIRGDAPSTETIEMFEGSTYPTNKTIDNTTSQYTRLEFDLLVSATAADGMFALQWAQNTSNAGTTRLWVASTMDVIEV